MFRAGEKTWAFKQVRPSYLYYVPGRLQIIYSWINCLSENDIPFYIEYWEKLIRCDDYEYKYLYDLKQNYKKYYNELAIKSIIE